MFQRERRMTGSIQLLVLLFSFCSGQSSQKTSGAPAPSILVRDPRKYPICVSDEDCESISEKEPSSNTHRHSQETFLFKYPLSLMINLLCGVGVYLRTGSVEARQLCVFPIHVLSPHRQRQEPSTEAVQEELGLR